MAGHSKWANIKHKKAREDKARGKKFTILIRELTVAAQEAGGDPSCNPRLRLAMDKAQSANMPKDTIMRAIQRGSGEQDMTSYETVRYEGYAVGGVALMVGCLTDNRNRTVGEVRHAFSKCGGNLGTDGSVAYMFDYIGEIHVVSDMGEEALMDLALEVGADDVRYEISGQSVFVTQPDQFSKVRDALLAKPALKVEDAKMCWLANLTVPIDHDHADKVLRLIEMLEDLDDVQDVFSNAIWPDADDV